MIKIQKSFSLFLIPLVMIIGCAYYNTLFNAMEKYEEGVTKIKSSRDGEITSDIRNDFYKTIDKCWKLINIYSDSSSYADEALLLIGKSYYQVKEYPKAERYLTQFNQKYNDSELITESYLLLAMVLIDMDRDDEALEHLNRVISSDEDDDLTAEAYYNLGRIYYKKEDYNNARIQFDQVIENSSNDELDANAQFMIAESYFDEQNYSEALPKYTDVNEFDTSIEMLYDANMRRVDCLIELDEHEQAITTLEEIAKTGKFLDKKAMVNARIGDIYVLQDQIPEATNMYDEIMETYPRTEGSAIAAYGMAKLLEFYYADIDSAKRLYQKVGKEYRDTEFLEEANERAGILDRYQKIRINIERDLADLEKINTDSLDVDSLSLEYAEIDTAEFDTAEIDTAEFDTSEIDTAEVDTVGTETKIKGKETAKPAKKPAKRLAVDIEKSLEKNMFSMAEFFLLTLVNYDSAAEAYQKFINSSNDSVLVPKAYYSLYYAYNYGLQLLDKADSIKQIILLDYPETPYATYLTGPKEDTIEDKNEISVYKNLFLQGEELISEEKYLGAIDIFRQIANEDSGSMLAQKSRYVIAWIYETKIEDIQGAVDAYALAVKEYPGSEVGKIAKNKIKEPVETDVQSPQTAVDSLSSPPPAADSLSSPPPAADSLFAPPQAEDSLTSPLQKANLNNIMKLENDKNIKSANDNTKSEQLDIENRIEKSDLDNKK
jgi:TolA-binding protein